MAANAKQYSDLQQASSVNDTDLIAVAQSDANELKTATVTQVATKVANIVSTDQLTEFITDVGLGKQVLAQKLNDKGAGVTASDTLVQMAAKIDPLDVVGAKEYLIGEVSFYRNLFSSTTVVVCPIGTHSNKALQITSGRAAIIEVADDGTLTELAHVEDTRFSTSRQVSMVRTNASGTTAIYMTAESTSTGVAIILDINLTTPNLTIRGSIEELQVPSISSTNNLCYISEDGTKCLLMQQRSNDTGLFNWLDLTALTVTVVDTSFPVRLGFNACSATVYEIGTDLFMFCTNSSLYDAYPITLDFTTHTVTVGTGYDFTSTITGYTNVGMAILPEEKLLFKTKYKNINTAAGVLVNTDILVQCFNLETNSLLDEIVLRLVHIPYGSGNYADVTRKPVPFVISVSDNSIVLSGSYMSILTFDKTTDKFDTTKLSHIVNNVYVAQATVMTTTGYETYVVYYPSVYLVNDVAKQVRLFTTSVTSYTTSFLHSVRNYTLPYVSNVCFGNLYKRNAHRIIQIMNIWDQELYEAGAYAVDSTSAVLDLTKQEAD